MTRKTKRGKKIKSFPVNRDENGMLIAFNLPWAATEWGDEIDFDQHDAIEDTKDFLIDQALEFPN